MYTYDRRPRTAVEDDEAHDPALGVLNKWDLADLEDKAAWKGYRYATPTHTWEAEHYGEQDEPDDWGDGGTGRIPWQAPVMTLDEVIEALKKPGFKWLHESDGILQSAPKKTKKTVKECEGHIERLDGDPLSYTERKHLKKELGLK